MISDNRLAHFGDSPQWYFENLGVLIDEEEFNKFFERNYLLDNNTDIEIHWCYGFNSFTKEDLYDLMKEMWKKSLKLKVIKDLKEEII